MWIWPRYHGCSKTNTFESSSRGPNRNGALGGEPALCPPHVGTFDHLPADAWLEFLPSGELTLGFYGDFWWNKKWWLNGDLLGFYGDFWWDLLGLNGIYPLVNIHKSIEHGHKNTWFLQWKMLIFHSYENVYQRLIGEGFTPWYSQGFSKMGDFHNGPVWTIAAFGSCSFWGKTNIAFWYRDAMIHHGNLRVLI